MIENGVVSIHIPPAWRDATDGHDEVTVSGDTIAEVIDALDHVHPGLRGRIVRDDGTPAVEIYLGGTPIRELDGLSTPIGLEETVSLIHLRER